MGKKTERGAWQGHPLLDREHATPLHLKAAIYEFQEGMARADAEKRALQEYRAEHHARAAAHHLAGMKASAAIGNHEAAEKHHDFYSLHVKALGQDPMGPVPPEVQKHRDPKESDKAEHVYDYKAHDADEFLVQPVTSSGPPLAAQAAQAAQAQPAAQPMQKAERTECISCGSRDVVPSVNSVGDTHKCRGCGEHFTPGKGYLSTHDGGGQTSEPRQGHLRIVKAEPLPATEVVMQKDLKDVTARLRKNLDLRQALADLAARIEKLR